MTSSIHIGWINLYRYSTNRLHCGTGVYDSCAMAEDIARHKNNFVRSVPIVMPDIQGLRVDANNECFKFTEPK